MNQTELLILKNLIHNEEYMRKVIPYLKRDYFKDDCAIVFEKIETFINKFNVSPTIEALEICLENDKNISEQSFTNIKTILVDVQEQFQSNSLEWLVEQTEKHCKEKALYNAILQSITIIDGKDKKLTEDAIPSLLQDALSVSFNPNVGHEYFDDSMARFEYYNRKESKLEFDIDYFNLITGGGIRKKTLNMLIASTGVGKSLVMCHMAAAWLKMNKNVLYISGEMSEESIGERIDANLLDIDIEKLRDTPKEIFETRVTKIRNRYTGKLIIKEYPTSTAHANHFRALLIELNLKKNFKPDVILVDYLNIFNSYRYKASGGHNSYVIVKAIAEEIRGLAVEYDVPIVSATQTNRGGYGNTDMELTETSESIGLPMTVDLMLGMTSTEELERLNQILFKQLKNRYNDPTKYRKFVVGIDRPKMRLYNLEDSAQQNLNQSTQPTMQAIKNGFEQANKQRTKEKFENFKY